MSCVLQVTPWVVYNFVQPRYTILLEFDSSGSLIDSFHDPEGATISGGLGEAFEHDDAIYIGHFSKPFVGYIKTADLYRD